MVKRLHVRFLAIFVFIGVVPFALTGLILIRQHNNTLEQQSSRELMGLSSSLATEMESQLNDMLNDAWAFAALPDIVSMDVERQAPVLKSLLDNTDNYGQLAVADLSGQLQSVGNEMPLVSIAHVPSFQDAKIGEQNWVVFPALFGDALILHMHTPIVDDTGKVVGVLGSPTSFPLLAESLAKISIGSGRAFVVDSEGRILIHSAPNDAGFFPGKSLLSEESIRSGADEAGSLTYSDAGTKWIAGYSRVPEFGWTIVTERLESEVLQPVTRARNLALLGLLGCTLLCFGIAYLMARSLTRPVRELATAAQAFGRGNPNVPIVETGHHSFEIATLIRSFNLMRNSVLEREQSLRQFHHAMAASIDGMAILEDGRFTYVNPALADLYGLQDPLELVGEEWLSLFNQDERMRADFDMKAATSQDGVWQGELLLTHLNGPDTFLDVSLTEIDRRESILVLRDLTERRKAEDRLILAQKLESLGLMAGGIAHDFNNLLAAMLGQAYVAKKKLSTESSATEHLERLIQSGRRASDLTRQLLAYAGKGHSLSTVFDLGDLIRENIYILDTAIPVDVDLTLELSSEGLFVEADKGQMQQIIMNLVINAAESIGERPGKIHVHAAICSDLYEIEHPDGATVVHHNFAPNSYDLNRCIALEVHDSGHGMNRETIQRVFDPFYTTKAQGSGLGLSSTLGIVQSMGGCVSVYSTEGVGSIFRLMFPIAGKNVSRKRDIPTTQDTFSGTALIVDDEPSVLSAMQDVLETCGMTVLSACDGQEAVNLHRMYSQKIDLILMDMRMPILNGLDALKSIKSFDANARVILMSGYTESREITRAIDNDTVFFMQKPYTYEQLMSHVDTLTQPSVRNSIDSKKVFSHGD